MMLQVFCGTDTFRILKSRTNRQFFSKNYKKFKDFVISLAN